MILLFVALAWLIGVGAAALGLGDLWPAAAAGAATATAGFVLTRKPREALACVALLAVALLGVWRFEAAQNPSHPGAVTGFAGGKPVALRGVVVEDAEQRVRSQRLVLEVQAYRAGSSWEPTDGRILVTTRPFPRFDYGDVLELYGSLDLPPRFDDFDYSAYLARRGIGAVASFPSLKRTATDGGSAWRRELGSVRGSLDAALARSMPEPEASLARGILLGSRASIPSELTDDMNRAGISHLIAISGYNVTLVAAFVVAALAWLIGRRPALVFAMLLVPLFAVFVGGGASVLRAAVMGEVMLGASLAGRPGRALNAVVFTGALLTAFTPSIVQDVSFQLSFAATLGIVLASRPLAQRLEALLAHVAPPIAAPLAESVSVTVAASLAVLPVMAATFGRVSFVALVPANLAAVWAFPLMMLGAALTAVAGVISEPLGRLVGDLAYVPLWYLVQVARLGSSLPYASLSVDGVGALGAAFGYVLLAALGLALLRPRRIDEPAPDAVPSVHLRLRPGIATALVMLVAAGWLGWSELADAAPGRLSASVLDVGHGDATLVQTPSGLRILIDGGPSADLLLQALGRELPASTHRIDLVILSDARDEHATGLVAVAERYDIGAVLISPRPGTGAAYRDLTDVLRGKGVEVTEASAGQWLDLGDGARLEVLAPDTDSAKAEMRPLALRLVRGDSSLLLAGALEPVEALKLAQDGFDLRSTALVLPRHGGDSGTPRGLIAAVSPRLAVVSVGDNAFGLPSPSTELALAGLPELRTDRNGTVRLRFDAAGLGVDFDRGTPRQVSSDSK